MIKQVNHLHQRALRSVAFLGCSRPNFFACKMQKRLLRKQGLNPPNFSALSCPAIFGQMKFLKKLWSTEKKT